VHLAKRYSRDEISEEEVGGKCGKLDEKRNLKLGKARRSWNNNVSVK
jgi:hypothetical protein